MIYSRPRALQYSTLIVTSPTAQTFDTSASSDSERSQGVDLLYLASGQKTQSTFHGDEKLVDQLVVIVFVIILILFIYSNLSINNTNRRIATIFHII